jgi:protein-S-isoprenylcysteine O-methyltransferase Ste14
MNIKILVAILAIIAVQTYYAISELRMTRRTLQGADNLADKGTRLLIWIMIFISFEGSWLPVIFRHGQIMNPGNWMTWVGVLFMIAGVVFRWYAISRLGKFFTATIQIQKDHQIIKAGPYRYLRHPSYSGILILTIGNGVALSNWISLLLCIALPAIGIIKRISVEEKELYLHFGEPYREYRKKTWRLIPFLY